MRSQPALSVTRTTQHYQHSAEAQGQRGGEGEREEGTIIRDQMKLNTLIILDSFGVIGKDETMVENPNKSIFKRFVSFLFLGNLL